MRRRAVISVLMLILALAVVSPVAGAALVKVEYRTIGGWAPSAQQGVVDPGALPWVLVVFSGSEDYRPIIEFRVPNTSDSITVAVQSGEILVAVFDSSVYDYEVGVDIAGEVLPGGWLRTGLEVGEGFYLLYVEASRSQDSLLLDFTVYRVAPGGHEPLGGFTAWFKGPLGPPRILWYRVMAGAVSPAPASSDPASRYEIIVQAPAGVLVELPVLVPQKVERRVVSEPGKAPRYEYTPLLSDIEVAVRGSELVSLDRLDINADGTPEGWLAWIRFKVTPGARVSIAAYDGSGELAASIGFVIDEAIAEEQSRSFWLYAGLGLAAAALALLFSRRR